MDDNANPNPNPANPRQQVIDKLKQANYVLVTVSNDPSVDQLAACIGLTLMANKLGKHATAVFSGKIPSTIEFLKPEDTLEKTTDSLRDFIIALDKSKADKLRYKVEDKVVKIFITPYKTKISDQDLDFSYGDFNVDLIVTLGVHQQKDLDQAIIAQGRILHDATIVSVNNSPDGNLGNISWIDTTASSLSEIIAGMDGEIGKNVLDGQTATALLTGIIAETERFSNKKTTPQTMSISAKLMSAGANQQLVVAKLEPPPAPPPPPVPSAPPKGPKNSGPPEAKKPPANDDGTLKVEHEDGPKAEESDKPDDSNQIEIDHQGNLRSLGDDQPSSATAPTVTGDGSTRITGPPTNNGKLTANIEPEKLEASTDPLSLPNVQPPAGDLGSHNSVVQPVGLETAQAAGPELNQPANGPLGGAAANYTAPDGLSLPPKQPLPELVTEHRQPIMGPPSTDFGAVSQPGPEVMDMPIPSSSPFEREDLPSGDAAGPGSPPPPPPVPPPPLPPVF